MDSEDLKKAPNAGALKQEIADLNDLLNNQMLKREKSLKTGFYVRLCALVIVTVYFGFLYHYAAAFTADEACRMVRGQLDAEIPRVQADVVAKMKESAPEVVQGQCQSVLDTIPVWRKNLQTVLVNDFNDNMQQVEDSLNKMCADLLAESKAEMDKMGSGMTTAQKVDRLSKEMRVKMFEDSREVVDGIAAEYTAKIKEVNNEIQELQTSKKLTENQKHQREVLRVSSKLMQMQLKDVNKEVEAVAEGLKK